MNKINYGLKTANLNSILNKQKNIKKYYQNHLCLAFVRNDDSDTCINRVFCSQA